MVRVADSVSTGEGTMRKLPRRRAMVSSIASLSQLGNRIVVPPTTRCGSTWAGTVAVNERFIAKMCTLPRRYRQDRALVRARRSTEPWVSSAPLGTPVVPLV